MAILGFGESYAQAPFNDPSIRIYGLNELYKYVPRWEEWIEIHDEESIGLTRRVGPEQVLAETAAHRRWLEQPHTGKTIWMQERFCDGRFPAAKPFPIEALREQFGRLTTGNWRYFTSTVALMIAQQIAAGRDAAWQVVDADQAVEWIGLFGIDLIGNREYEYQRPCVEFFVGLARGIGIDVFIAPGSAILQGDHIYGFERPIGDLGPVSRARLEERRTHLRKQHDDLVASIHRVKGALMETENWLTVQEGARRGITQLPNAFLKG